MAGVSAGHVCLRSTVTGFQVPLQSFCKVQILYAYLLTFAETK
jgi:hypothetical protein